MRKQIVLAAILLASCFGYNANAQVSVHFNIGSQPVWGPTGYTYARYYYIPDIDAYYDVNAQDYVYLQDGQWVTSAYLPPAYANFDLYSAHKVVLNYANPRMYHDRDRDRYYSYRGRHDQGVIRDSRDQRYWANPNHPMHERWNGNYQHEQQRDWGGNRGRDWGGNRGRDWNGDRGHYDRGEHRDEGRGHDDHDHR